MKEISVILKNNILITVEEFRILHKYAFTGRIWTLVQRPPDGKPHITKCRTIEYIFEDDSLTMFGLVSRNILAYWETEMTRNLKTGQEYQIKDSLFIYPYPDS